MGDSTYWVKMVLKLKLRTLILHQKLGSGLCSSSAKEPQATNFCLWATRKTYFLHNDEVLGTLDFIVESLWAPCDFS